MMDILGYAIGIIAVAVLAVCWPRVVYGPRDQLDEAECNAPRVIHGMSDAQLEELRASYRMPRSENGELRWGDPPWLAQLTADEVLREERDRRQAG